MNDFTKYLIKCIEDYAPTDDEDELSYDVIMDTESELGMYLFDLLDYYPKEVEDE